MDAFTSSLVSIVFLGSGLAAVLIMLNLEGRIKNRVHPQRWIRAHRVLGYLFILLFLVQLVLMAGRVSVEFFKFSPRSNLHAALALILIPMLLIKVLLARFFKSMHAWVISLGLIIFFVAFVMVALTAGYYLLTYAPPPAAEEDLLSILQRYGGY